MRLNRKILIFTIGTLAAFLVISSLVNIASFSRNYTEALLTGAIGVGRSLETLLEERLARGRPLEQLTGVNEKLAEVVEMNPHIAYAGILKLNGEVLFHSQSELIGRMFDDGVVSKAAQAVEPVWQHDLRFDGVRYFDVAVPLRDGDRPVGVIRLGFPAALIDDKIMAIVRQLLVNMLVTFLLIAVLLNLYLRNLIVKPVKRLSKFANAIARGQFDPTLKSARGDEFGLLRDSLVRMGGTLRQQIAALKQSGHEMEEQVHARTRQLSQSNRTLEQSNASLKQALKRERELTEALRRSEERFRMLFEGNKAVMLIIDPQGGRIIDANRAAIDYYGWPVEDLLSMRISDINTLSESEVAREMKNARKEKRSHFYFRHTLSNGMVRDVEVHSGPIDWDGRPLLYSIIHDVTARKQAEAELERIAHYDALTGLPNRLLKTDRLRQSIARSRRNHTSVGVCYLDLDGFKPINDVFGHEVGDIILVEIAHRLLATVREGDTVSRIGGDEFVLILSDLVDAEQCTQILDRVLDAISEPIKVDAVEVRVFASIGLTLYPRDDADADILMRHADQAMYVAKEMGKNRYHQFDPVQDKQVKAHRENYLQLQQALTREEFVLHYQPKINMYTCEVIGVEALIRWRHPDKGLCYPGDFLFYITNTDLEITVGNWVIECAMQQVTAFRASGVVLPVSVNISAQHLQAAGFVEYIQRMLLAYPAVQPGDLEFEILESSSIEDMSDIFQTLVSCREMGIRFALDDFGTGYSSLAYFHRLPVDSLKIDQAFVQNMLEDPQDLTIVDSVVRLAGAFQHPVIAEGVESLEHGAALLRLGCHLGQGYGIARPMPPEQLHAWLQSWQQEREWHELKTRFTQGEGIDIQAAVSSHRRWVGKLIESLSGDLALPPVPLDSRHCAFGRWFHGVGYIRYGRLPVYEEIRTLHEQIHQHAQAMYDLASHNMKEQALSKVKELENMRDSFIECVECLYDADGLRETTQERVSNSRR